jgi:hypothetical protein
MGDRIGPAGFRARLCDHPPATVFLVRAAPILSCEPRFG